MILKDKITIVTGGGSGIGRGIALRYAYEGADVVIVGRTKSKLSETAAAITGLGRNPLVQVADVSCAADVARMVKETVDKFGKIDVLVNNAGIMIRKDFFHYLEEDWDKMMAVNLKSVFLCCKEVVPIMLRQGKGKIINIVSGAGMLGFRRGAYGPSKAGVINFTAALGLELAPYGINVNAITPGATDTDMLAAVKATPKMERQVISTIPCGRLATPDDIAGPAVFLASGDSDYMVGSVLMVEGGQLTTFCRY